MGKQDRSRKGLTALAEALAVVEKTGERCYEAELYRLKGELTLHSLESESPEAEVPSPQAPITSSTQAEAEEAKDVSSKPLRLPASSKRNRWNCAR